MPIAPARRHHFGASPVERGGSGERADEQARRAEVRGLTEWPTSARVGELEAERAMAEQLGGAPDAEHQGRDGSSSNDDRRCGARRARVPGEKQCREA